MRPVNIKLNISICTWLFAECFFIFCSLDSDICGVALKLGAWCINQRAIRKAGRLSPDRIEKLEEIHFSWDVLEDNWYQNYERVKKYIAEHGDFPQLPIKDNSEETKQLYQWLRTQRYAYNKGVLSENRIQLLEEINIVWDRNDEIWENNFLLFQKFYQEYGRLPKNSEMIDGYGIGQWYLIQLKEYKRGCLSEEKIKRFKDAGFSVLSQIN